ncbi:MAG: RHS repeat-associated core domain-containing protein, partial [Chloroflexota bacterium]|nr:RHS repeat-associated core domain-containing protein [Chloroflexota bacterium]
ARNRLTTMTMPDGNGSQEWTYAADGLPSRIVTYNDGGATSAVNTYQYNRRRLMSVDKFEHPGWYWWSIGSTYDVNGNLASHTYPSGQSVAYAPNAMGQPTRAGTYATGVSYYPNGALKQFTYGNGLVHTMTQNARQLPHMVTDSGNALAHTYVYDANGNPLQIWDNIAGTPTQQHRFLRYDGLDRLTGAGSQMFGGDHWHHYTYDVLDNIKSWKLAGVKDYAEYVYDGAKRLTNIRNSSGATMIGLGYDLQGNLSAKNGQGYQFDYGNRLRAVTGIETYRYDGHGRRIQNINASTGTLISQYSADGKLMYHRDVRSGKNTRTDYIYLAGSQVAKREQDVGTGVVKVKYQHTDALGSPVAVSDQTGAVIERTNYEPYGAAIGKTVDGVGFTGHVMDGATGLTYMQQRYYDPSIGRFLSVDAVTADGNTGSNFNRYWYANNNPYKFTDPDGRIAETPWDAFNVALDVVSLGKNLAVGNYAGAAVDAVGLVVDAVATVVPGVPGGAGAAIKAARLADNVRQGAKAEKAVAKELGGKVAGQRVTLEASTGQRSVADIVTKDKGVVEVKSGNAQLSSGQKAIKADVDAGRSVTPRGQNAEKAGLEPGKPTQMKCYDVKRC